MNYAYEQLTMFYLAKNEYITSQEMAAQYHLDPSLVSSIINMWLNLKLIRREVTNPGVYIVNNSKVKEYIKKEKIC